MTYQRVTEYTVSALPENYCVDSYIWDVVISYRGGDQWAVRAYARCLSDDGSWDHESLPSERADDWLKHHRFPLEEALKRAHDIAPTITINNLTPADLFEKYGPDGQKRKEWYR